MKKGNLTLILGAAAMLSVSAFTIVSSNGTKVGYTISPPDGPGDCSGCHGSGSATPVPTLTAVPAFGAGNTYVPGTTYTVSLGVTGYPKFGFDLEMINGQLSTSTDAGTGFANVANTRITPPGSFPTCTNMSHSIAIASTSKAQWKWVAPSTGTVYIYAAILGANGDGNTGGDKCIDYTHTLTVSPTGVAGHENAPVGFMMFPNPASDHLHLDYVLEKRGTVSVQIFDMNGKLVAELFNKTQDAGEQNFDAALPADLSKGIYTLSLSVNGISTMKKLMIR